MTPAAASDPEGILVAHGDAMRRLARALVYDEHLSQDVAQEAVLVALERHPPPGSPVRAWLSGVVRNVARNVLRGERRRRAREAAAAAPARATAPSPLDQVAQVEAQQRVVDAVLALDEPYRRVIVSRFFEGRSVDEIAATEETRH